uniref:Uncharacterized protein n=1 Tax=Timema monikensis TaxID=170555 RepID=A0A7R9EF56_9NEOP|nr:unnamed protein product [Timema monikensis]
MNLTTRPQTKKPHLSTPDRDSNLDLLVIGKLVHCESSVLDQVAAEVLIISITSDSCRSHDLMYEYMKVDQRKCIRTCMEGEWNRDLPVLGSLVYCENSALDHVATNGLVCVTLMLEWTANDGEIGVRSPIGYTEVFYSSVVFHPTNSDTFLSKIQPSSFLTHRCNVDE